jgi:hypothetical protein
VTDTAHAQALSALDQLLATTGNPVSDDVAAIVQPLDPPLTDDEVHAAGEQHGWPMEFRVMVLMVVRTARD